MNELWRGHHLRLLHRWEFLRIYYGRTHRERPIVHIFGRFHGSRFIPYWVGGRIPIAYVILRGGSLSICDCLMINWLIRLGGNRGCTNRGTHRIQREWMHHRGMAEDIPDWLKLLTDEFIVRPVLILETVYVIKDLNHLMHHFGGACP